MQEECQDKEEECQPDVECQPEEAVVCQLVAEVLVAKEEQATARSGEI